MSGRLSRSHRLWSLNLEAVALASVFGQAPLRAPNKIRPNGSGERSPGLRPKADALGGEDDPSLRPERSRDRRAGAQFHT